MHRKEKKFTQRTLNLQMCPHFSKVSTNKGVYQRFQKHLSMLWNQGELYLAYTSFEYIYPEYTNEN